MGSLWIFCLPPFCICVIVQIGESPVVFVGPSNVKAGGLKAQIKKPASGKEGEYGKRIWRWDGVVEKHVAGGRGQQGRTFTQAIRFVNLRFRSDFFASL